METTSADSMDRVAQWFEMLKLMRVDSMSYDQLYSTERIRSPVHRVCKLLNVEKISDIVDDDLLYQAVVRVAQMETELLPEELSAVLDGRTMDLLYEPSHMSYTTRTDIPTDELMFRRKGGIGGAQSQRPKNLSAMLNIALDSDAQQERKYSKFLQLADISMQEIANACIGVTPSFTCTTPESNKKIIHNSSLLNIFLSYSKVDNIVNKQSVSKSERDDGKALIHIQEFIFFGEDFGIFPRLISKRDLKTIWSAVSLRYTRSGLGHLIGLNLNDFKDILARVALFSYHKVTARDLIMKLNNTIMPLQVELIEYLCRYLHLDDENWVKRQLKKRNTHNIKPEICTFGLVRTDNVTRTGSLKFAKTVEKVALSPKHSPQIFEPARAELLPFLKDRLGLRKDLKVSTPRSKALPGAMEEIFESNKEVDVDMISEKDDLGSDMEEASAAAKHPQAVINSSMTSEQRYFINADMNPSNLRYFKKYSYDPSDSKESEWSFPGGAFIDMGCLSPGSECVIRLDIKNRTGDEIYTDISCRGFESGDLRAITEPSGLIPGLTKSLRILFTVEAGNKAVVGNIEIFVTCVRTTFSYVVSCPVHYRVGPPNPERDWKCTAQNLTQLLVKDTGRRRIDTVNFQTKKFELVRDRMDTGDRGDRGAGRRSSNQVDETNTKAYSSSNFADTIPRV